MPLRKQDLTTPALLVDLDTLEANIQTLQTAVAAAGKQLRPHAKAHKCLELARRQLQAGAAGVCVATEPEMELMIAAGIDVLLTTPVATCSRTIHIAEWIRGGACISAVVDSPFQVQLYQSAGADAGVMIPLLVDLDVGDHRTGVPCDERALALARAVESSRNLRFAGLQA